MKRPPYGISLPCRFVRARDGDTIEVSLPGSDRILALRLIDCWAPEIRGEDKPAGMAAKKFAEKCLRAAEQLSVFVPAPENHLNLLAALTFDRIPAYLFLNTTKTLNESLVENGFAHKSKQEKPK